MQKFLAEVRNLNVPNDFEGGNNRQRMKLNEALKCLRDIKTAAEQDPGGGGEADLAGTIILFGIANGVRAAWRVVGSVIPAEDL